MRMTRANSMVLALFLVGVGHAAAIAEPQKNPVMPPPGARGAVILPTGPDGTPAVIVDDDKVESLLGKVVTSQTGDKLGQITDVLVGHGGDMRAAVVDFGGFLGVGTRKVAVSWSSLKFSQDAIMLNMTRDQLRVTPEYREHEPIVIVGPQTSPAASLSSTKQKSPK